ncbi:MAG: serine--tRNA ligase [Patescibacteria group bacterium]|jgi:seryl-tRNA synthetase|nr:serine--tRNA ligase [Patescibacteria group bacterium]MDD5172889.1 serine--tRNA ligase [Patescibacteria group bacterium]
MIDIKIFRQNPEKIKKACEDKQVKINIDEIIRLDKKRRGIIKENEELKSQHNQFSKKISPLEGEGKQELIKQAKDLIEKIKKSDELLEEVEKKFKILFLQIPNPALPYVKVGENDKENEVIKKWGKISEFKFKIKDHIAIGEDLDLLDIDRAGKVSGSRFSYLKNELAFLEYALVQFTFKTLVKHGFTPMVPPVMIKPKAMESMGYLERGKEEIYQTTQDNLYLVGTSEQSIGPMHMNEILEKGELPKRYVSFSTCFRREAGSYGQDVKGILRVHQFDKIEMFSFCLPEKSEEEHKFLLQREEELVQALKIPYQVIKMCTGDLGGPAAAKYDIECWMPGQNRYRETHSTSNCTDFQARRLNVKYRNKDGNLEFVYTLNGTAFAVGRILIAILENYQQKDGSIKVPKVLRQYLDFKKIYRKK